MTGLSPTGLSPTGSSPTVSPPAPSSSGSAATSAGRVRLTIGVLQTGDIRPELIGRHGDYPPMFERLLTAADPDLAFRTYRALDGVLPEHPGECDGWLITGSKFGVYDPEPWIPPLKDFIRTAYAAGAPLIGVCFGHQIMAEALGGRAEKSDKGWGVGAHVYEVADGDPAWAGAWAGEAPETLRLYAMHQDQVTQVPPDARTIASSPFCAHAALAYGPETRPTAISIQPHPEFDRAYEADLIELRVGAAIPAETAAAAWESLDAPVDALAAARWMVAFLRARASAA